MSVSHVNTILHIEQLVCRVIEYAKHENSGYKNSQIPDFGIIDTTFLENGDIDFI